MNHSALIAKLSLLRDYCSTTDFAIIKAEDVQEAIDIIRAYESEPTEKQKTIAIMAASIYSPDRARGVFSDFEAYVGVANNLYYMIR